MRKLCLNPSQIPLSMIIQVQNRVNIFMSYIQPWSRGSWCLGSPHCPQWLSHSSATHAKSVPQQHCKLLFPRSPILVFASKFKEAQGLPIWVRCLPNWDSQVTLMGKNLPEMQKMQEVQIRSLGREDPLEEEIATHSSILAWRIP